MTTKQVEDFAETASEYCAWCRNRPSTELNEARIALRQLSRLYVLGQELRQLEGVPEVETDQVDNSAWRAIYERFGAMPFNYYASVFDPRAVGASEVTTGDLADDLADVYRDLIPGLSAFRAGHSDAAEWEWAWSFRSHWGRHAASAIHALHCWFADEAEW